LITTSFCTINVDYIFFFTHTIITKIIALMSLLYSQIDENLLNWWLYIQIGWNMLIWKWNLDASLTFLQNGFILLGKIGWRRERGISRNFLASLAYTIIFMLTIKGKISHFRPNWSKFTMGKIILVVYIQVLKCTLLL